MVFLAAFEVFEVAVLDAFGAPAFAEVPAEGVFARDFVVLVGFPTLDAIDEDPPKDASQPPAIIAPAPQECGIIAQSAPSPKRGRAFADGLMKTLEARRFRRIRS